MKKQAGGDLWNVRRFTTVPVIAHLNLTSFSLSSLSRDDKVKFKLPEPPALGMQRKDWLSLVAVHSDWWLLSVSLCFGARLNSNESNGSWRFCATTYNNPVYFHDPWKPFLQEIKFPTSVLHLWQLMVKEQQSLLNMITVLANSAASLKKRIED